MVSQENSIIRDDTRLRKGLLAKWFDIQCWTSALDLPLLHLTATGAQLPIWMQLPVMRAAGQHVVGCHDDIHRPVIVTHGHCLHHLCPVRQCNCNSTHITLSSMACSQEPYSRSGQPMTQDTVLPGRPDAERQNLCPQSAVAAGH